MKSKTALDPSIGKALDVIRRFITETTGREPADEEIADALKRYFVLNEIKAHIVMVRAQNVPKQN